MRPRLLLLLWVAWFPLSFAAPPGEAVAVVELRHRAASEILPLLEQAAGNTELQIEGATLTLRGKPAEVAKLQAMAARLDARQRQFAVTVRQFPQRTSGRIGTGAPPGGNGVRVYSSERERSEGIAQQLRLTEGTWARISSGASVPVGGVLPHPFGAGALPSVDYQRLDSGFALRLTLGEAEVTLDVRAFRARLSPEGGGVIEHQQLESTLQGRLGEWIALSGEPAPWSDSEEQVVYSTAEKAVETFQVFVKVELAD